MNRLIRVLTVLVVLAVASFAAVVSYTHIYDLARAHGQVGAAARLLPLSVDGLILAASLVLLDAARRSDTAPLAQAMLWLGIGATLAANALYGAAWGILGVLVSAWPAVAFIGSAEMLFYMVRRTSRTETTEASSSARLAPVLPEVPVDGLGAARLAYEASVRGGNPLSARELDRRFGIGRPTAAKLAKEVSQAGNGHHAEVGELEVMTT